MVNNDIDLFIHINGVRDQYHIEAEEVLSKWLRKIEYEEFTYPEDFVNTHPESLRQTVNGKKISYTVMAMFYNDSKCFKIIDTYSKNNNINYDIICKFRPDIDFRTNIDFIESNKRLIFKDIYQDNNTLHCCFPPCAIRLYGDRHPEVPYCITSAFDFGSYNVMKRYCSTYDNIIKMNSKYNGNFRLNYEVSLSECFWGEESFPQYTEDIVERITNAVLKCEFKMFHFNFPYTVNDRRCERDIIKRDDSHNK